MFIAPFVLATSHPQPNSLENAQKKLILLSSPNKTQLSKINFIASYLTAISAAIAFHPYDRALYLSISHQRPFFSKVNFTRPFQGVWQTLMYKQITSSAYFIAQGELQQRLYPWLHNSIGLNESITQLCIGSVAGVVDGSVKNPPSAIRAFTWQHEKSFFTGAREMWRDGGIKPFANGIQATLLRDVFLGACYELLRKNLREYLEAQTNNKKQTRIVNFVSDTISAGCATILSAPINYARIMQYQTPPSLESPSIKESVISLVKNTLASSNTLRGKLCFFQGATGIGAATLRVAFSTGIMQFSADFLRKQLQSALTDPTPSVTGNMAKSIIR
jgi:hypothetical protein